jgi:Helix-turn-helix domain
MDTLFIPNENDFRRWIKEALKESLENTPAKGTHQDPSLEEPLLTRKEIAGIFRISLVTLHDWMNRGLPCHKQRGRVYFIRSEVMEYVKRNHRKSFQEAQTSDKKKS